MYEYSDLSRNNHLSMLPDYVFSYGIIPNLIASVTQRNLYLIDAKLKSHKARCFHSSLHQWNICLRD